MPGLNQSYTIAGRKRQRRTPYRAVNVREPDFYGIHQLANRLRLSLVDTFALLVRSNSETLETDPAPGHRPPAECQ